ncbi:MAG: DUF5686 family protein [Bacteroidetes bacterium]|nr:DUF5686 family protein [Bacteroidota bacterium]MDA1120748.1 DUF5686 family protein [Bacteroidota bacterium]
MRLLHFPVLLLLFISCCDLLAQQTTIKGRVKEALTGSPVPFANVVLEGTTKGTTTDFDGYYTLSTSDPSESLVVTYIGFIRKAKPIEKGKDQVIDFQLEEEVVKLEGVTVIAGENPAFPILRNVVSRKDQNNKRNIKAYQYESYTKIEVDVSNMSDRFKDRKLVRKVSSVLDSIEVVAGEDGEPVLPIFMSEAISNYYFKNNPKLQYEHVLKTKISGVGIEDGSFTSQIIGGTFQEYNFYQNWINIFGKDFASPIGDFSKATYEYDLVDSVYLDSIFTYRLDFWPKRDQDLAFQGTMWIAKDEYALKRIDAFVNKSANLNFIRRLKIQQDLVPIDEGMGWIPVKTRVVVDAIGIGKDATGLLFKFYTSLRDIQVNNPHPDDFYLQPIKTDINVRDYDVTYWETNRHEALSATEVNVFRMIDTLKTIPTIKTATDLVKIAGTGYYDVGKFDLGPWWLLWANNDVEGVRLGMGGRTNEKFSKKVEFWGDAAYGLRDQEWKYGGGANFILSREHWTVLGINHRKDIDPVWIVNDDALTSPLFRSFSKFGTLQHPFMHYTNAINFQSTPFKGLTTKVSLKYQYFEPLKEFGYKEQQDRTDSPIGSSFQTSEIGFELRYARDELVGVNDNSQVNFGTIRSPVISLKYTAGLDNTFGSDFSFHRLTGKLVKKVRMGGIGSGNIRIDGGYIFGQVPYPLLKTHIGNEYPVYYSYAFNQMDFFEFVSDSYVELKYRHQFEGLILNKIPLMKKLKWRLVGNANFAMGSVRSENLEEINVLVDKCDGTQRLPFTTFDGAKPYIELGGGIENIFKFFYFGIMQRMTYLGRPNVRKTGLIFGVQFIL